MTEQIKIESVGINDFIDQDEIRFNLISDVLKRQTKRRMSMVDENQEFEELLEKAKLPKIRNS